MYRVGNAMVLCVLLAACSEEQAPPPAPLEVVVAQAGSQRYVPEVVYVGRLRATDDVQIRASVTGYLEARHFREGDTVEQGRLLYEIDRSEYLADQSRALALQARQEAALEVARRNFARGRELAPQGYISASELDELRAAMLEAQAGLQEARAQVKAAEVALGYTRINAPITGRIGRSEVSVGDLVGPDTGVLTTLVSADPIKAHFQINEQTLLAVERLRRRRADEGRPLPAIDVSLELATGERYTHRGRIDFLANRVDATTGTLAVRATLPNPEEVLRPGQYVRVHLSLEPRDVLMIPQGAVQSDQQGAYVLTVIDNTVERHNVVLGERDGTRVIVDQGLKPGDKVIVGGLQKAQPGQSVTTRPLVAPDEADTAAPPETDGRVSSGETRAPIDADQPAAGQD